MGDYTPKRLMKTLLLALGVLCANIIIYVSGAHQYYFTVSHLYYGVMLLAALYESSRNQNLLLGLTTAANWIYVLQYPKQIESFAVAFFISGCGVSVCPNDSSTADPAPKSCQRDGQD